MPAPSLVFRDRTDAGRRLAALLERFRREQPLVAAMPRGGVPVAAEVARSLAAPLDVVGVRKIGAPGNPEFAVGAVAEGGGGVISDSAVRALRLSDVEVGALIDGAVRELEEQMRRFRGAAGPLAVADRTAIVVDDGLATGRSAAAALTSLRERGASRVILAVPVAAPASVDALRAVADEIVTVITPAEMWAVGLWYEDFRPTPDEEVVALLAAQARRIAADGP